MSVARRIRDNDSAKIAGIRPAHGESCSFCNRKPPSNRLFEIVLDPIADEGVRIGMTLCAATFGCACEAACRFVEIRFV